MVAMTVTEKGALPNWAGVPWAMRNQVSTVLLAKLLLMEQVN
jgi:hypothetical protein